MGRLQRGKGGRPPKFSGPRRPVTVTLPETTLRQLQAIDRDRARAIVKVAGALMPEPADGRGFVEVVEVTPGVGIIVVGPSFYLQRIPWLRLVEIAPARFLLTIPSGTPVDSLELALIDLTDTVPPSESRERSIVQDLRCLIGTLRRGRQITKAEMLFIDTTTLPDRRLLRAGVSGRPENDGVTRRDILL